MAVGDMGKKAIQFGRNVAFGLRGSTIGWAEGIGMRELKANMSDVQKKRLKQYGKKAYDIAKSKGETESKAKATATAVRRQLGERMLAKETMGYKVGDFLGSGVRGIYKNKQAGLSIDKAVAKAFTRNARDKSGQLVRDQSGNLVKQLNAKAVAGTAVTAGMAARIATGGGLYRDRNGNVNLPVVPFI